MIEFQRYKSTNSPKKDGKYDSNNFQIKSNLNSFKPKTTILSNTNDMFHTFYQINNKNQS